MLESVFFFSVDIGRKSDSFSYPGDFDLTWCCALKAGSVLVAGALYVCWGWTSSLKKPAKV